MYEFNYKRASSLNEALDLLDTYKERCKILAGGTDVLVQLRKDSSEYKSIDMLIDISNLKEELSYIKEENGNIEIGALSTHKNLAESQLLKNILPFIPQAALTVGSPQTRVQGTIGGNVCNASPAADPVSTLVAMDTVVIICSKNSKREVLITDFYEKSGTVNLQPNEIVTAFRIPLNNKKWNTIFVKLGRRKSLAISRLNVAAALEFDADGVITDARLVPGCIFKTPDRVKDVEKIMIGQKPSEELFIQVGQEVSKEMIKRTGVRWSTEYKKPAIEGMVTRALIDLTEV